MKEEPILFRSQTLGFRPPFTAGARIAETSPVPEDWMVTAQSKSPAEGVNRGRSLRLLFLHEHFGALAGTEANLRVTAAELQRRGHTVGLAHGDDTGKGAADWRDTFPTRFPLGGTDRAGSLRTALEAFQPDLVYVHKMPDLAVLQALVDSGQRLVRMVHDHELYCMRGYKYNALTRSICTRAFSPVCIFPCGANLARNRDGGPPLKWVSYQAKKREIQLNQRFDRLLVATHYMREELLRNGFDGRRIEIHPPVPRMGDPGLRSSFSDRNLILYTGQIIRGKGVDVLLESLARVRVPFQCVILGDGNHRAHCEKLSRQLGLDDRVQFKGFVRQEELKTAYKDCTVMVVSSLWPEPFGAVGLEGMRYGLPVVAFDAGGIKEWLIDGFNGYLVPWMDRNRFAARLEELLLNKKLARQMGQNGLEWVTQRFNFSQYVTGLENMFSQVVNEAAPRVPS